MRQDWLIFGGGIYLSPLPIMVMLDSACWMKCIVLIHLGVEFHGSRLANTIRHYSAKREVADLQSAKYTFESQPVNGWQAACGLAGQFVVVNRSVAAPWYLLDLLFGFGHCFHMG